jgi:hypothetical protein
MHDYSVIWALKGFTNVEAATEEAATDIFDNSQCQLTLDISPKQMRDTSHDGLEIEFVNKNRESDTFAVHWILEGHTVVCAETEKDAREIFKQLAPDHIEFPYISISICGMGIGHTYIFGLTLENIDLIEHEDFETDSQADGAAN